MYCLCDVYIKQKNYFNVLTVMVIKGEKTKKTLKYNSPK